MGEPKLRCVVGLNYGAAYPIAGHRFVIGRAKDCQMRFDDPTVSARHAEVAFDGATLTISDLASRNGVKVNGKRVARANLANGDLVTLGALVLRVEWPSREPAAHEPEEWQKPAPPKPSLKRWIAALSAVGLVGILAGLLFAALQDQAKLNTKAGKVGPVLSSTLHAAAAAGKLEAIRQHVQARRNINAQNEYGFTPLHSAVSNGKFEAVRLLLELGADPTIRSNDGVSPLDLAKMKGDQRIVQILSEWKRR